MSAQMEAFRRFVASAGPRRWKPSDDKIVIVGSGKGGSGVSTVTALLGLACAAEGHRTLLVDGDELVGTLHRLFGIEAPVGLGRLLSGSCAPDDCVHALGGGLSLLPGGAGTDVPGGHRLHALSDGERQALFRRISPLYGAHDIVIVDAGSRLDAVVAAASAGVRRFLTVAEEGAVPGAASYALAKAIERRWPGAPVDVVVNRQDDPRGRVVFERLREASLRFLDHDLEYAGTIPEDEELRAAVLAGQPLEILTDHTVAAQAAQLLAQRLLNQFDDRRYRLSRA